MTQLNRKEKGELMGRLKKNCVEKSCTLICICSNSYIILYKYIIQDGQIRDEENLVFVMKMVRFIFICSMEQSLRVSIVCDFGHVNIIYFAVDKLTDI